MEGEKRKNDRKKIFMDGDDGLYVHHYFDTVYTLCHVYLSKKDSESAGKGGDGIRVWTDAGGDSSRTP